MRRQEVEVEVESEEGGENGLCGSRVWGWFGFAVDLTCVGG